MAIDRRSSRLGVLALVALLLVGALGTRLWFLQAVQAEDFQSRVDAAKQRTVYIPPERGRIFDAKGRVMADNQRILTVTVERNVVRRTSDRQELWKRLSGALGVPVEELEERYTGRPDEDGDLVSIYDPLLPLPLKEDVDEATVQYLMERSEDYPGVSVSEEWRRVYPYSPLASHVVGYMGAITGDTIDEYLAKGYNRNERVGQFGVEASLEETLHGRWGWQVWEIDAAGNTVRLLEEQAPVAGNDVQLSIDLDVQQYAEQALETQLRNRRNLPASLPEGVGGETQQRNQVDPETGQRQDPNNGPTVPFKAPAGSVVVLDHSNGQVMAMASYPTFDNRWFNAGISKDKFDQLFPATDDPDRSILVNRAVQGRYNIGSTIKPFVAWSAMHSGVIGPQEYIRDDGTYTLESIDPEVCATGVRCEFKNAISAGDGLPSRYGPVSVLEALAVSSDVFFYRLGEKFFTLPGRRDELKADLQQFGFGADSGIELPFEWDGRIPDDAVKAELVEAGVLAEGEQPRLLTGDLVQVAIGQGLFAATPLQLANAYATLANGGFLMTPHLVKAIYAPLTPDAAPAVADLQAGTVIDRLDDRPEIRRELPMPQEIRDPIIAGLTRVIRGPGVYYPAGRYRSTTGEALFENFPYDELPIAGKTGTAQGANNYGWNDSSAFGAFSLDGSQPYTVVAYLEKSGYGARAAAPVVKCVLGVLAGQIAPDPVLPSDALDIDRLVVAPERTMTDQSCLSGDAALTVTD
jgi:penicillin-binding protein 2